ncbi:aerotaxis receptor [Rhodopirellula rubra]|uniref:Aerotaxis receptor n=1 Tax=Aporhodopirellula rubra TaxID=980271 RepID=A0A7W5E576_9BACT|nr:PAS domain-containing protein [Aporhodopirellula rubra]MBB3210375.1 aerotaxis receptor [Aporhodopirellula rubra]
MTTATPVCLDRESVFKVNELFFSTTDQRGVIRYGNGVFTRVSGYESEELIGKAHSIVRHPDMPRSVFRLFWNTLGEGETIAAYVKNRSKDGSYYWVMAVAAPISGGYLSVRLKPTSGLLDTVAGVYSGVLADERAASENGMSKDEVAEIGLLSLMAEINRLGFADYPSFMRHALSSEMVSRHNIVKSKQGKARSSRTYRSTGMFSSVDDLAESNFRCDEILGKMLQQLSSLRASNQSFVAINRATMALSRTIGTSALNARINADTPTTRAISQALAETELENRKAIIAMNEAVTTLSLSFEQLAFDVSVAALQGEIASQFLREVQLAGDDADLESIEYVLLLLSESRLRYQILFDRMNQTGEWFGSLDGITEKLHRNAKTIRFVRIAGIKESAHLSAEHPFREIFNEINSLIVETNNHCNELRHQVSQAKQSIAAVSQAKMLLGSEAERQSAVSYQLQLETSGN